MRAPVVTSPLPMQPSPKTYHPRWGWLCIFLGLYPIAFALKIFPTDDTTGVAPMWISFLCGLGFVLGGAVVLIKRHSRINTLLATLILLILGATSIGIALFSSAEGFVGGFTALSAAQNVVLARWMFGLGAILSFLMSGYGIHQFLLSTIHPYSPPSSSLEEQDSVRPHHTSDGRRNVRQGQARPFRLNLLKQLTRSNGHRKTRFAQPPQRTQRPQRKRQQTRVNRASNPPRRH